MSVSTKRFYFFALLTLSLLMPARGFAQAPVTDDTYAQNGSNGSHGTESHFYLQTPNVNSYLRFNLGVYPSGLQSSSIQKAVLRLFVNEYPIDPGTFYVCRLASNQPWLETGLNG
jgi:hypothetical protein